MFLEKNDLNRIFNHPTVTACSRLSAGNKDDAFKADEPSQSEDAEALPFAK
jgi:hypothetical protein